ncbi:hypothetical protein CANMA_004266 [Candida margitis]|uniref:uncharacterized protein n=1 Tax=Candida margitis TaxID=1775924 RepID=UPI002227D684|nr:uncharacterized protein CANMA_004266 [Candida margitis]KAI5958422.1 hypothetical protein CANMA_004266 [Candida margitis]
MTNPKINYRLVVTSESHQGYTKSSFLEELRDLKNTELTTLDIEKADKEKFTFPHALEYIHLLVEYDEKKWEKLTKYTDYLKSNSQLLTENTNVGCHIFFNGDKSWKDYSAIDVEQYKKFISTVKNICGDKVTHLSIVNKFSHGDEDGNKSEVEAEIRSDVEPWKNLKHLDYTESSVESFPDIKFPKSLEVLNISGDFFLNQLSFTMPSKLKRFHASSGSLSYLHGIHLPASLETLDLSGNKLYMLDDIKFPNSLTDIDLSENRIDHLAGARWPPKLESLSIAFNPIESLKGAAFPPLLKFLDASTIPNDAMVGVKFPESLEVLNLQSAMTTPRGLKVPSNVKTLVLSEDGVTSVNTLKLPNGIETLYLNGNKIKTLNKVQFPSSLKELYLGDNLLTTLKNVVFPNSLETLDIENDPESFDNEKQIITLRDVSLPPNLKVLKLGYQGIRILENYEFPQSLTHLSLTYNDMKSIRSIKFGNNLKILDLSGNPELLSLENVKIPESVTELRVPEEMVPNLPADIVDRANKNKIILKKIPTNISVYEGPLFDGPGVFSGAQIQEAMEKTKQERIAGFERAE